MRKNKLTQGSELKNLEQILNRQLRRLRLHFQQKNYKFNTNYQLKYYKEYKNLEFIITLSIKCVVSNNIFVKLKEVSKWDFLVSIRNLIIDDLEKEMNKWQNSLNYPIFFAIFEMYKNLRFGIRETMWWPDHTEKIKFMALKKFYHLFVKFGSFYH